LLLDLLSWTREFGVQQLMHNLANRFVARIACLTSIILADRLASPVTVTRILPFDIRRCLSGLAQGSAFGARQLSSARLED